MTMQYSNKSDAQNHWRHLLELAGVLVAPAVFLLLLLLL